MTQFDVEAFIDRTRIGPVQWAVLVLSIFICFVDGFDIYMVGKVAPAIAASFGKPPAAMTGLMVWQQIGLGVGAFIVSPLADRVGRRTMLVVACTLFGCLTLAGVLAQSLAQLTVLRALGGLAMSAGMPMALAMISEVTPRHRRGTFVAIGMAGFSAGSAASGAVAAWLLDLYGWRSGFWIGGLVPLLCAPLILLFVPESIKFRAERNPADPRIANAVRRLAPLEPLTGEELFVLGSGPAEGRKARLSDVVAEGRARMTVILFCACALSMMNIALMAAWLPSFFFQMAGVPIQRFAVVALIAYAGGIVGTLVVGALMDRFNAALVTATFAVATAICLASLAWVPFASAGFIPLALVWSFFQTGLQGSLNTYVTGAYPPRMRTTALGWAGGLGRMGGAIAPIAGGFALAQHLSLKLTLGLAALLPLAVALLALLLARTGHRLAPSHAALA